MMTQFRVPKSSFPFISPVGAQTTLPPGNYSFDGGSFLKKKKKIDFMNDRVPTPWCNDNQLGTSILGILDPEMISHDARVFGNCSEITH